MLDALDESLEAFLRAEVPLPDKEVDISFATPDRDWSAGITKPTVNLYLWDIRQSVQQRQAGWQLTEQDGRQVRTRPKPRVDLRYLVTAWTTEVRDEHALLGAVLAALLRFPEFPEEHLQGVPREVRPLPTLAAATAEGPDQADLWSALDGQLKPGLDLNLTATIDALAPQEAGPPVERYEVAVGADGEPASSRRYVGGRAPGSPPGTRVVSPRGIAATDTEGRFRVPAEEGDRITIESDPPVEIEVPGAGMIEEES